MRCPIAQRAIGKATTVAVGLAGALALTGPALAEWAALAAVREGVSRCPDGGARCGGLAQADVDLAGLRLWHPWREQAGLRIEADELAVTVDADGVQVDASALRLARVAPPEPGPARVPAKAKAEAAAPERVGERRSRLHTHGIPVHVRVQGSPTWSMAGVALTLGQPELHLDGHGNATASFALGAEGRGVRADGTDRFTATTVGGDPHRWQVDGPLTIAEGTASRAALTLSRQGVDVALHDAQGGRLTVWAPLPRPGSASLGSSSLRLEAEGFAMATLGRLGRRTLEGWGLHTADVELDAALTVSGGSGRDAGSVEIERLRVQGLVIDHRTLARAPVELDALELQGELSWREGIAGGTVWVAHRQARLMLAAQLGPTAFDLRTELAPLSCQALLDAFPAAMSEMVAGTVLQGQLRAYAELHVDRLALARARAEGSAVLDPEHPALGRLDFELPFLERCTVLADDPRLDLAALSGAYHHRFVDDHGRPQRRVLAPGGPGTVSLRDVPLLVRAFVVMEDRRFWQHDGFDRDQMEHAFWHNLVKGRVSRGASTISQQAARNLWLGVDRSWGRKLQEALLTARLEASTDKARIMELYLNVIELGPGTHGVDEAARLYFGMPASELSVLQSVHLAALAPAPRRYAKRFEDGRVDPQWLERLHEHVRRLHRAGLISWAQQQQALRDELRLLDRR